MVVKVKAEKLNDIGLAYDFTDLKRYLKEVIDRFDHTCLNDVPPFDKINPSAENIAAAIYHELDDKLKEEPVTLVSVAAWESPEQGVTYCPG